MAPPCDGRGGYPNMKLGKFFGAGVLLVSIGVGCGGDDATQTIFGAGGTSDASVDSPSSGGRGGSSAAGAGVGGRGNSGGASTSTAGGAGGAAGDGGAG